MKNKYRIIELRARGITAYEVQIKFWWFPVVWIECWDPPYVVNTHRSIEHAKDFIEWHKQKKKAVVLEV